MRRNYRAHYDIAKSFRKIRDYQKTQENAASYIKAKNLDITVDKLYTRASGVLGTDKVNVKAKNTKVGTSITKNEIDRRVGIDNGFLGINYNNVKKNENLSVGSTVQSLGDIVADVDKTLSIIGSRVKGHKVELKAENVNIEDAKNTVNSEVEIRNVAKNL